jgi:phage-related protein
MLDEQRIVEYVGSSKKDLSKLDMEVQEVFLQAIEMARVGLKHDNAKIMRGFHGASVLEVVEDYMSDTYRAVYTVKFEKAVYVLHVFKKKSKKGSETPKPDLDLIKGRLKAAEADYKINYLGKNHGRGKNRNYT